MDVRVIPRASRTELAGIRDEAVLVRIQAPPVEGAANDRLITFLADLIGIPKRQIEIVGGEKVRRKRLLVKDVSVARVREALAVKS